MLCACSIRGVCVISFAPMISTSGKIAWGELLGQSTGLIQLASPPARATESELQKLTSQLPYFLQEANGVGSITKNLSRLVAPV